MKDFDWRTLVVVPATLALLVALIFAFQANPDRITQFFATLLAALIAAGAVVTGYHFQHRLAIEREQRQAERDRRRSALRLQGFLSSVSNQLSLFEKFRPNFIVAPNAAATPADAMDVNVEVLRRGIPLPDAQELVKASDLAETLPDALATELLENLFGISSELASYRWRFISDGKPLQRSVWDVTVGVARGRIRLLEHAQHELGKFLSSN